MNFPSRAIIVVYYYDFFAARFINRFINLKNSLFVGKLVGTLFSIIVPCSMNIFQIMINFSNETSKITKNEFYSFLVMLKFFSLFPNLNFPSRCIMLFYYSLYDPSNSKNITNLGLHHYK